MATFHAVSKERHASQRWIPYTSYAFASADAIAPLVAQELPRAMMALPLAFVPHDDGFIPVAVQGIQPGKNLWVDANGRWLAAYVPATYRGYPFALSDGGEGQKVLCIREGENILSSTEGERFFDDDGQPARRVQDVMNFLTQVAANREVTQRLSDVLQKHELIQPWPITLKGADGEKTIQGLFRIDEAALNALSAEAFQEVRESGALPIAYCQLLSMQHLSKLGELAQAHATQQATLPATAGGELDLEFLNDGGTISFADS